jgi:hypothetical protein
MGVRDPREKPDPPYRWMGLVIAAGVMIGTYFYHVSWWTDFAR